MNLTTTLTTNSVSSHFPGGHPNPPFYISLLDISIMMGNQDYWNIKFFDENAKTYTLEKAINAVQDGYALGIHRRGEYLAILDFDGDYFQVFQYRSLTN